MRKKSFRVREGGRIGGVRLRVWVLGNVNLHRGGRLDLLGAGEAATGECADYRRGTESKFRIGKYSEPGTRGARFAPWRALHDIENELQSYKSNVRE